MGQHFKVNIVVDLDLEKNKDSQMFIGLNAPSPIEHVNKTILTWHKIDKRNVRLYHLLNLMTLDCEHQWLRD